VTPTCRIFRLTALGALSMTLASCVTTPVPVPPTLVEVDVSVIDIDDEIDAPTIPVTGGPGSIEPADATLRITNADVDPHASVEFVPETDGSFSVDIPPGDRYFLEQITAGDDFFLVAVATSDEGAVEVVDPGPDADGDGSPDAIDCAPDDEEHRGQRCP
jgi:hypothetical protein